MKEMSNGNLKALESVVFRHNDINRTSIVDGFVDAIEKLEEIKEIDLSQTKLNENDLCSRT